MPGTRTPGAKVYSIGTKVVFLGQYIVKAGPSDSVDLNYELEPGDDCVITRIVVPQNTNGHGEEIEATPENAAYRVVVKKPHGLHDLRPCSSARPGHNLIAHTLLSSNVRTYVPPKEDDFFQDGDFAMLNEDVRFGFKILEKGTVIQIASIPKSRTGGVLNRPRVHTAYYQYRDVEWYQPMISYYNPIHYSIPHAYLAPVEI